MCPSTSVYKFITLFVDLEQIDVLLGSIIVLRHSVGIEDRCLTKGKI
jgi:hypothetical protein